MAYTYKIVNGKKIALTSGDQTKLTAKDAANFQPGPPPPPALTTAEKFRKMARTFGLSVTELKAEIFRP